jgi:alpha-beta hydrolase superfamily lysophospholipase
MKPKYLLAISIGLIVILLLGVAGFVWWQNGFEDYLPIRGNQVAVGLVPKDSVYLSARYYPAPGKVASRGVVLMHQYNSSQNAWNDFAAELQDRGFAVMTFDWPGHGDSSGDLASLTEQDYEAFPTYAAEAIEYLRDINADMEIAVVGGGLGANAAMQLADQDGSVAAVLMVSPQNNYRGIKINGINKKFTRPVFYLVSRADTVSLTATESLYKNSPSTQKELRIAEEANGRGTKLLRHAPKIRSAMIDWLEEVI